MEIFQLIAGEGPLVAAAIHAGHWVRPDIAELLLPDDADRLREEDPFTDALTEVAPTRLIAGRSRFEVDLNRPREQAVYMKPEDCWGMSIWKSISPSYVIERSLANYDLFYATVEVLLRKLAAIHQRVIVLDIHSYNHRRDGPHGPLADAEANPDVNIGTGAMDRLRWAPVVDAFIEELRRYDFLGRRLDVRENVRFRGGHFPRWIHETFPESICAIAIEFKKFFMDEWTGEVNRRQFAELQAALQSTQPRLLEALDEIDPRSTSMHAPR
jgi:N-formylglutamate amidohydrolase